MTDCHDVSLAVVKQSESDLRQALFISPHDVNAANQFGQTALHLSIDWPLGMRILLDAGADTECVDQAGLVPLHYAIERLLVDPIRILGQANCSFRDQRWISVSETTHGKMEKGSLVDQSKMDHQWKFLEFLIYRSVVKGEEFLLVLDTLLDLIVSRRKRLYDLARQTIPLSEIARWLPQSSDESHVIDETASRLAFELEYRGIHVPPHLHPGKDQITGYHCSAGCPTVAERLWKFGFRDVDGKDSFGRTPLMVHTYFRSKEWWRFVSLSRHSFARWLEFVTWTLSKGADLYARQDVKFIEGQFGTELLSASAISFSAWKLGLAFAFRLCFDFPVHRRSREGFPVLLKKGAPENTQQTLRKIVTDCTTDDCTCSCSASGCTTRTLIFRSYTSNTRGGNLCERTNNYQETILHLAQLTDTDAALGSSETLRLLTFQELGLKHTCCYWRCVNNLSEVFVLMRIEDQSEINEFLEDSAGLSVLEKLLSEFELKMEELDIPFPDFLTDYWGPRMEQVHEERKSSDMGALRSLDSSGRRLGLNLKSVVDGFRV